VLAILVPALWIIFDVAICLRTGYMNYPFSGLEWWWLLAGLTLAGLALIAQWRERSASDKAMRDVNGKLEKAQAFHEGAYSVLGRRLDIIETQAKASGNTAISSEVLQLKAELNPVKGMSAEITSLTAKRDLNIVGPPASIVYVGLTVLNRGPATAIREYLCSYRRAGGKQIVIRSPAFLRVDTEEGRGKGRNLATDEEVIPHNGKRSGYLAFVASEEDTRQIMNLDDEGEVTVSFSDVLGNGYLTTFFHNPFLRRKSNAS
jgi:hypothetical protein